MSPECNVPTWLPSLCVFSGHFEMTGRPCADLKSSDALIAARDCHCGKMMTRSASQYLFAAVSPFDRFLSLSLRNLKFDVGRHCVLQPLPLLRTPSAENGGCPAAESCPARSGGAEVWRSVREDSHMMSAEGGGGRGSPKLGLVGRLEVEVIKSEMFLDVVCECSFPQRAEDNDDEQRA